MAGSDDKLNAIYIRLGELAEATSAGHARIEGETKVIAQRLTALDEKVKTQNGRVTKLENQVGDLKIRATVRDHDATEDDAKRTALEARVWGFVGGALLLVIGAVIGNVL